MNQMSEKSEDKILLWGGGSMALIIREMISELYDLKPSLIFDCHRTNAHRQHDIPFINNKNDLEISAFNCFFVCIGNDYGFARAKIGKRLMEHGLKSINIIDRQSTVNKKVEIGNGCLIMPSTTINLYCEIGDFTIINTAATVDHECQIGSGVHIMGGASIAGRVRIENYASIGTNATILPDLVIGENAFVAAGAVVTKNVKANTVVAGVPAKEIGTRRKTISETDSSILKI